MTAADLIKTEKILTAAPDASLASALNQTHSSHDAVFVVEKNRLLGVISVYQVLYRGHKPAGTKVKNCLFLAPKLKPETRLDQIARLMLESKTYFLPVVTAGGKWLGIVSYRRLLRQLTGLKVQPKPVTVCRENLTLGQARNLMKKSGFSRLVVVNQSGRLSGILTRSDLNQTLSLPPQTPVKAYIKRSVTTFRLQDDPIAVVHQMLERNIGSAVMVNQNFQPIGILSVRDCLAALARPTAAAPVSPLQVRLKQVRSGFEAFARQGQTAAHAFGRFKKQTLRKSLDRLKRRLGKK